MQLQVRRRAQVRGCAWLAGALIVVAAVSAYGQTYRWVDKDGKVRYGDTPPAGAKSKALGSPASGAAAGTAAQPPAKAAEKGAAAKEDPREAAEKAEREKKEAAMARDYCNFARQQLAALESGQRISRTDAKGERYFLDDAQRNQETAKFKESESQWCK